MCIYNLNNALFISGCHMGMYNWFSKGICMSYVSYGTGLVPLLIVYIVVLASY